MVGEEEGEEEEEEEDSPMARERLRQPFTRPSSETCPPAPLMRSYSSANCGLWSRDSSKALEGTTR